MKAMIPVDRMARIRLMEMFSSSCVAVLLFRAMDCDMDLRPFPTFPFLGPALLSHHSVMPGSLLEWRLFAQKYKKILGSGALYQGSSYY